MSRNGSGTYNLPAGNPVVTGTTITTTWANTTLSDIASALTGSVSADGQTPMTGSLNLANNKILNVTDPTTAQDAATKAYVDAADTANLALSLLKASNLSDVASATTSRTNLVAAKSGANSDITSITGLTTPLTVAQGGIGVATLTANNVLLGNGTSAPLAVAPSTSGNVLTSNGTTWTSATPATSLPGVLGQAFTSSGTFTIPSGVTALKVTVVGGGGGGAAGYNNIGGRGGSAGGIAISYLTSLTPTSTIAVTVGGAGGQSKIASGTQTITTVTVNGAGGSVTGGTINMVGGSASTQSQDGSAGASSLFGGSGASSNGGVGGSATAYGAGGGGGYGYNNCGVPGGYAGGAGYQGIVIFEW